MAEADSNSVGVFLGNGNGTFAESILTLPGSATTLAVGDFNHDGKLDIVAPFDDENSSIYMVMLRGLGTGKFGTPVITPVAGFTPGMFWASSADLNGDGVPDLLLTSETIDNIAVQVFLNNGNGTFSAGQVVAQNLRPNINLGTLLFDADGDGITDALVEDEFGILSVYHGNGDGTFNTSTPSSFAIGDATYGIAAAATDPHTMCCNQSSLPHSSSLLWKIRFQVPKGLGSFC